MAQDIWDRLCNHFSSEKFQHDPHTKVEPDRIEFYGLTHYSSDTKFWINPGAERLYNEMIALRAQHDSDSDNLMTTDEICDQVLETKSGYIRGLGHDLKHMRLITRKLQSLKPSYPFLEVDPNMELVNQFTELNPTVLDSPNLNYHSFMGFSNDTFFSHQTPEFPGNLEENFPGIFHLNEQNVMPVAQPIVSEGNYCHESKKRKAMDVSESSSGNSSSPVSETGIKRKNVMSSRRGKRVKGNEKEEGKTKEVVHVRARRGQATDSHSLAERVRRGKINEKLRCLQDIVPGCYKTMGMAVMLDEIINYVQSLQNQVEFLSMKLTAASTFYDFNSETDAMEMMQRAKAHEAQQKERLLTEGYGGLACLQPTWPL
ncbi:hypothetical protein L1049_027932 [Liquidambar formosana]|uniref:BHLH domain-containing protein n=1 Tax=Liquidambar formosana TaxID=63359 RepID=A0AAP0RI66_LIQFO